MKKEQLNALKRLVLSLPEEEAAEVLKKFNKGELTGYPSIDLPHHFDIAKRKQNPSIPNMSIINAIELLSLFYRKREAIECHDLVLNYKELLNKSVTISKAFKELGVKQGQIVTISMPNLTQAVAAFLACNRIGAVATFLNYSSHNEEIISYLNEFESPLFLTFDKSSEELDLIKSKTKVDYIVSLRKDDVNRIDLHDNFSIHKNDSIINYNNLGNIAKFQKSNFERLHKGNEDALILFTSGTTGNPKSVVLSNENIIAAGTYLRNSSNITQNKIDQRTLVCVPFAYPYGFATSTLMSFLSGRTAVLAPFINKDNVTYYLDKKPNMIFGSPALLELIQNNVPDDYDLSSVTTFISGGDFLTPEANSRGVKFFEKHGACVELGNGSGNAETVSCGTNPVGIKIRPETAGRVLAGTGAIIIDPDTLEEKKYGEEGLMCVSGKHVFKGYFNNDELTNDSFVEIDGKKYFKTGTLGYIDEEGYFTITSRQSRFYITSSLNKVYCDKIQRILCQLDFVRDCAVVQVPDEDELYVNKAYIVINKEYENSDRDFEKELLNLANNSISSSLGGAMQLKSFEIPRYVEIVDFLPRKEGTDKIDYALLEQDAKEKLESKKLVKN